MKMQSPPPENAKTITPGKITATKHAVTKFVNKRAEGLCRGRIGWWGTRAVEYAIWLHLENVIATIPDSDLEEAVERYLNPDEVNHG